MLVYTVNVLLQDNFSRKFARFSVYNVQASKALAYKKFQNMVLWIKTRPREEGCESVKRVLYYAMTPLGTTW